MKISIVNVGLLVLLMGVSCWVSAQQNYYKYRVGPTGGATWYHGDLVDKVPQMKHYAGPTYGANLERSFSKTFGLRLEGSKGETAYDARTLNWNDELLTDNPYFNDGLNFQTNFWDASLSVVMYPDNDRWMNDKANIAPYLSLGYGLTNYEVLGNLKDANGNGYDFNLTNVSKDDSYETNLVAETRTHHIPLGLGLKFRVNDRWNLNLETKIKYLLTDDFDNLNVNDANDLPVNINNDFYAYSSASLNYNFGLKKRTIKAPVIVVDRYSKLSLADSVE